MTEKKRFIPISVEWIDGFVQDHYDNKDLFSINEVCDLLNELSNKILQLEKENEQLKLHQKNTAKEFQTLLNFIRSKGLTLTEYEKFKGDDGMTGKRFEVMDYFDSENNPIKAIRDTETTEIYSMDNELEANSTCGLLNTLHEEKEYLKIRFKEERELAMKISRECDALTIKKQELELELIRLETIRTGKKVNGGND